MQEKFSLFCWKVLSKHYTHSINQKQRHWLSSSIKSYVENGLKVIIWYEISIYCKICFLKTEVFKNLCPWNWRNPLIHKFVLFISLHLFVEMNERVHSLRTCIGHVYMLIDELRRKFNSNTIRKNMTWFCFLKWMNLPTLSNMII